MSAVAFSGLALVASACGSSGSSAKAGGSVSPAKPGSSVSPAKEGSSGGSPVVVGLSIALTGPLAVPALPRGYQEAVDEANAAGGVMVAGVRHPVKLTVLDNRSDSTLLTSQATTLVLQDHAVALVSGCCNLNVNEATLVNSLHVPLVGTAIPTNLVAKVNGQWAWDVFINLASGANYFSQVVPALGQTNGKVALIANNNPQGEGAQQIFLAAAKAGGFSVTAQSLVPVGTTDYSSFINQAKSTQADNLVAQMDGPDCFALWKQMKALGYQPKTAEANQCGANPTWRNLGALGNGALLGLNWTPQASLPDVARVSAMLNRLYPGDVADQEVAANSYTAMAVLFSAMTRAGSTNSASINTRSARPTGHSRWAWSSSTPSTTGVGRASSRSGRTETLSRCIRR